jgi:enoyl-CoA hydratase/carnithine racemase
VLFEESDRVATVTLNRPERRNAWTLELALELSGALAHCDADDDIREVVVTGAGNCFQRRRRPFRR